MTQSATSIFDQRVYAQDTEPVDTRDGNLWADTSSDPPVVKVYSTASSAWERAAPSAIKVQDTAPAGPVEGDGWVDTSLTPPRLKLYDGAGWQQESPVRTVNGQTGDVSTYTPDTREASNVSLASGASFNTSTHGARTVFQVACTNSDSTNYFDVSWNQQSQSSADYYYRVEETQSSGGDVDYEVVRL